MPNRILRFIGGACIAIVLPTPTAVLASHSWNGYHWGRTTNPFLIQVGNNLSGVWSPLSSSSYTEALTDWSNPPPDLPTELRLSSVPGGVSNTKRCPPTAGRVEVCNNIYGNNGWLGIAQIWLSGSHITQGTVKLNDTYFNTASYNKPEWRNLVLCQELGHTLGLDHQDTNNFNVNLGTCMDYTSNPRPLLPLLNNEHPNRHDYEQLVTIYTHTDSAGTATVNQISPNLPNEAGGNNRSEWGMLMRSTHGGRTELFIRDLGGGHQLATFVIWAEGRNRAPTP